MQNYTISINNSDKYNLYNYSFSKLKYENTVIITGISFDDLINLLTNINTVSIYLNDSKINEIKNFDSYSSVTYIPFTDNINGWEVTFTKTDIISKIEKIEEQVNPLVDIESMSISEYRQYILSNISQQCEEDIHAGEIIDISSGEKLFTFKSEDQMNLTNAFNLISQSNGTITYFPYHASGEECELFPATDIIHVHLTLQSRLVKLTTYCNQLNMYIKTLNTKEELSNIKYGMELPKEYQDSMDNLMKISDSITNQLRASLLASLAEE